MAHIFIVTGTSGGGKDSIVKALLESDPQLFRVVTHTSRSMRPGEQEGFDYYFTDENTFKKMIDNEELVEWTLVYEQYKGISKAEIEKGLASGKDVLLRINIDGVEKVKKIYPQAKSFFVTAPTNEEIIARLNGRNTDLDHQKLVRINEIDREHELAKNCDHIIYNKTGHFNQALTEVQNLINQYRN